MYERGSFFLFFFFFCPFLLGDGSSLIFIPPFLSKLQCSYHSCMFYFSNFLLQAIRNWAFGTGPMVIDDLMITGLVDSRTSESLVSY